MKAWIGNEPPLVYQRQRASGAAVALGFALATFVICGAQWLAGGGTQYAIASLAALGTLPAWWVLSEVGL